MRALLGGAGTTASVERSMDLSSRFVELYLVLFTTSRLV